MESVALDRHDPPHGLRARRRRPPAHARSSSAASASRRSTRAARRSAPAYASNIFAPQAALPHRYRHAIADTTIRQSQRLAESADNLVLRIPRVSALIVVSAGLNRACGACYGGGMTDARRATVGALALVVLLTGRSAIDAAGETAPELAAALQRRYDGIKDFSADFTHTYEGGVLRKQITERGHLLVKKPGKMRWDYTAPGAEAVRVRRREDVFLHSAGQAGHRRDRAAEDQADDADAVPRRQGQPDARFHALARRCTRRGCRREPGAEACAQNAANGTTIGWCSSSTRRRLAIRGLVTVDAQGGKSSFSFTNLKENVGSDR